jgi:hypothetical protein
MVQSKGWKESLQIQSNSSSCTERGAAEWNSAYLGLLTSLHARKAFFPDLPKINFIHSLMSAVLILNYSVAYIGD